MGTFKTMTEEEEEPAMPQQVEIPSSPPRDKAKTKKRANEPKKKMSEAMKKAKLVKEKRKEMALRFQNFRFIYPKAGSTYYALFVSAFKEKEERRKVSSFVFDLDLFKEHVHPESTITTPLVVLSGSMTFCSYGKSLEKFINSVFESKGTGTDSFDCTVLDGKTLSKAIRVSLKNGVFNFCYVKK